MNDLVQWLLDGETATARGDLPAAIAAFTRARDAAPLETSVALLLANAHRLSGDTLAARAALLAAHRSTPPDDPEPRFTLGAALLEMGAPAEAATCFAAVVQARPKDPAALAALAGAIRTTGKAAEAWPLIQRALAVSRAHPAYLLTAAQIRHELGDLRGALRWLDAAEAARPGHAPTQLQRAYTTLLGGATAEGWRLFDARPLPVPATSARPWHGESMDGASVLVTAEQGVGDQFQFLRFLRLLELRRPCRIVIECHADAVSLMRANGIDAVARGKPPETDWHVPLLSLPHRLGLGGQLHGDAVPYLHAPAGTAIPTLPAAAPGERRLGLVWAGNPAFPGRLTRDLDPALLPRLLRIPAVRWISLQQGATDAADQPGLTRLPPLADWATTAATLAALDGLVTTDTGIAHLAGAMGVRTWVLLQHVPDWRWGLSGETSPWYPRMTLVRPDAPGDWTSVVGKLEATLGRVAE